jgi:hypothetical protein
MQELEFETAELLPARETLTHMRGHHHSSGFSFTNGSYNGNGNGDGSWGIANGALDGNLNGSAIYVNVLSN